MRARAIKLKEAADTKRAVPEPAQQQTTRFANPCGRGISTLTVCVLEGASLTDGAAPPKWSDTSFCSCRSGRTAAGTATVVARPAKLYGDRMNDSWQIKSLSWLYQHASQVRLPSYFLYLRG